MLRYHPRLFLLLVYSFVCYVLFVSRERVEKIYDFKNKIGLANKGRKKSQSVTFQSPFCLVHFEVNLPKG